MKTKNHKKAKFLNRSYYFTQAVLLLFAVSTPQLIHSPWSDIENHLQSAVLLTVAAIMLLFHKVHGKYSQTYRKKAVSKEQQLIDSYAYIGKINNALALFRKFITFPVQSEKKESDQKKVFQALLVHMLQSCAHAAEGFVRFVDTKTGRTIAEYHSAEQKRPHRGRISNGKIMSTPKRIEEYSAQAAVIESHYVGAHVRCLLCFNNENSAKVDWPLLRMLLTQYHLLFLALQPARG